MTVQMTETDVLEIVGAAVAGGVVLVILLIGLLIYLLVRPPRRSREAPPAEAVDAEEMLALMERMERRLAALERAVDPQRPAQRITDEAGARRPETRRKQ
jgi:hypothetical protein